MTAPPGAYAVDLHSHSTASDGAVPAADVAARARAAGLSAFALTDHDTVAGIPVAMAASIELGIRLVPGVELSAMLHDREVHILGLHVSDVAALHERLAEFRVQRAERAVRIVERLQNLGVAITIEDVRHHAGDGAIGRPHVARALIASGAARDFREAFDRYLGGGRAAFVAKPRLSVRDAAAIIHDAGAIAVWAHPGGEGRREAIENLVADGLDGVEVLHPGHSPEDVARLRALCDHLRIVPSGGSDWHGDTGGLRTLGAMGVPGEWLERQDALVASRARAGAS